MNNKININPSSTKWLEKDDRAVADYFCDLGFRSLKQILDMRVEYAGPERCPSRGSDHLLI